MLAKSVLTTAALAVAVIAIQPVTGASAGGLSEGRTVIAGVPSHSGSFLPQKIGCREARKLVKRNGFRKIKKVECNGFTYTFTGKTRNGKYRLTLLVNAVTKTVRAI
jgi:hypothetical protein